MKIHLIAYLSNQFAGRKSDLIQNIEQFSKIDRWKIYGPKDLDNKFRKKYKSILSQARGGGYWIWKPYIINDYLKIMPEEDILFYIDGGCILNNSQEAHQIFEGYIELIKKHHILRFALPYVEGAWSNSTTINYFKNKYSISEEKLVHTPQLMSTVMGLKKCRISVNFIDEMLNILSEDPNLYTDFYNNIDRKKDFIEHRHDQSIFSLLFKCLGEGITIKDESYSQNQSQKNNCPILSVRVQKPDFFYKLKSFPMRAIKKLSRIYRKILS